MASAFELMHMLHPGRPITVTQQPVDRHGRPVGQPAVFSGHLKSMHADNAWGVEAEIVLDSHTPAPPAQPRKSKTRAQFIQQLLSVAETSKMEKFTTTTVVNKRSRTIDVYVEDEAGRFLVPGKLPTDDFAPASAGDDEAYEGSYARVKRAMGAEMPVFATFPIEIWSSFARAAFGQGEDL